MRFLALDNKIFFFPAFVVLVFFFAFTQMLYAATDDPSKRARMSLTPSSGKVPLTVKATINAESQLLCTAFAIDWGDGSPEEKYDPGVYDANCYGGKFVREFTHTYATSSIYTIKAKAGPDSLDKLNTMSLPVTVYDSDWSGDSSTTTEKYCFINPSSGYVPFATAGYVPLGGADCDGSLEYYVSWGDGTRSESRKCENKANHYDVFFHEYATSSTYTAEFINVIGTTTTTISSCEVEVNEAPEIKLLKPIGGEHFVIGAQSDIKWSVKNVPGEWKGIKPTVRLTFITLDGQIGFIKDMPIDKAEYKWTPSAAPCTEGACQSSIVPGKYYIQANLIYDICNGDPYCGKSVPIIATSKSADTILVSDIGIPTDTWLFTVRDRMFAHPLRAETYSTVYFTTVLNSDASCAGGTYTIDYGDGTSSSVAYQRGKCAAFASSFTHSYSRAGVYKVVLYKNGIASASMNIFVTDKLSEKDFVERNVASVFNVFADFLTKLITFDF